jgi:hypothetical protein
MTLAQLMARFDENQESIELKLRVSVEEMKEISALLEKLRKQ